MKKLILVLDDKIVFEEELTKDKIDFMICVIIEQLTKNNIFCSVDSDSEGNTIISDEIWINGGIARLDTSREEYIRESERMDRIIKEAL